LESNRGFQSKLNDQDRQIQTLGTNVKSRNAQILAKEQELEAANAALRQCEAEKEALQQQLADLEARLETATGAEKNALRKEQAAVQANLAKSQQTAKDLEARIQELMESNADLKAQVAKLTGNVASRNTTIEGLLAKIQGLEQASREQVAQRETNATNLRAQIQGKQRELDALGARTNSLQAQLEDVTARLGSSTSQADYANVWNEKERLAKELQACKDASAQANQQFQAQIQTLRAENEQLRRSLENDRAALLAHYEPLVAGYYDEIQRLTLALRECEEARKNSEQAQVELKNAKATLSDLQRKMEADTAEYTRRIRECDATEKRLSISIPRSPVPSSAPSSVPSTPASFPPVPYNSVVNPVPSTPSVSVSLPFVSGGQKTLREYCTDDRITKQQLEKPYRDWTQKQLDSECKHISRIRNRTLKGGQEPRRRKTRKHRQKETKT
jgi:chromosome segregation ATPase